MEHSSNLGRAHAGFLGAGLGFIGVGIAFLVIGSSGQAFLMGVGVAFVALAMVFLAKSRRATGK